jgi:hypothetical protein
VWNVVGLALASFVALAAWRRSQGAGGFYDRETYGMGPSAHRRYAAVSAAFAGFFAVAYALRAETAGVIALALYAVIALLYATSFLRGATADDE